MASAQSVAPSNATLPSGESSAENQVKLTGGGLIDAKIYTIAPLTTAVGEGQSSTAVGVRPSLHQLALPPRSS
jgi:hypothetical protein